MKYCEMQDIAPTISTGKSICQVLWKIWDMQDKVTYCLSEPGFHRKVRDNLQDKKERPPRE